MGAVEVAHANREWIRHPRPAPEQDAARRGILLAALLALAVVLLVGVTLLDPTGLAIAKGLADRATGADRTLHVEGMAAAAREWPTRPIPAEWRWSPPGVDVDAMFRKSR